MVPELEAGEELREHSAFPGASFASGRLRDGVEVDVAFSRQNGAVVVCGGPWYLNAIADLITSLVLWEAFCCILAQKSVAFLSFVA